MSNHSDPTVPIRMPISLSGSSPGEGMALLDGFEDDEKTEVIVRKKPISVMFYDNTDRNRSWDFLNNYGLPSVSFPGLSHAWRIGGSLYRSLRYLHAYKGVSSWEEAFDWLETVGGRHNYLKQVDFWGHGSWGEAYINGERINSRSIDRGSKFSESIQKVSARMHEDSLWWFRTCMSFGGKTGHKFAKSWAGILNCNVAGHLCVIGDWGLHSLGYALRPREKPHWDPRAGIDKSSWHGEGDRDVPISSSLGLPNTISCLHAKVPSSWYQKLQLIG